jgi:tetratricopeptide (TPR) repeat protein
LWADHFDGPLEDVFDLQDKVASSVAGVIEPALQEAETARSTGRPTTNLTAYDLYLRAHAMVWSSARQLPEALGLLEQAIARDPHYEPALAWAAFCCYRLLLDGRSDDPAADRLKGADFAQRALKIAADDPEVIVNAALALSYFGEDIGAMIALVDRALALNPNFARGWHVGGILRLFAGHPDLAIEHAETALRLSPRARVGTSLSLIGQAHFLARRFEEAVPKLLLAIQDDPSFPAPYRYLTACYAHMGRLAEAQEITRRLRAIGGVVIPDTRNLRNAEHRELYLSGLRLASGEEGGVMAAPPRVDFPRDSVSIRHREAERRQITAMSCELVGAAPGATVRLLKICAKRSAAFSAASQRRPIATKAQFTGSSAIARWSCSATPRRMNTTPSRRSARVSNCARRSESCEAMRTCRCAAGLASRPAWSSSAIPSGPRWLGAKA